jgi:hypothetical protein
LVLEASEADDQFNERLVQLELQARGKPPDLSRYCAMIARACHADRFVEYKRIEQQIHRLIRGGRQRDYDEAVDLLKQVRGILSRTEPTPSGLPCFNASKADIIGSPLSCEHCAGQLSIASESWPRPLVTRLNVGAMRQVVGAW